MDFVVKDMDWMERQIPPPTWHDEGDILKHLDEDSYCPLTSVVRRCYLSHLEQTLLHNYNSCRTQTIHQSTLQDLILHWEQNALRACMVTTIYQKAMRQLINSIKDDTKENKLTSVLTATIKRSQRLHLVDASTQTESATSTVELTDKHPTVDGFDLKNQLKREHSVTRESSDGPFLTPPSEYPLPIQAAKKASRRQLPFPPQEAPSELKKASPSFDNDSLQVPYQFHVPPPGYQFVPQRLYHDQFTDNWPVNHDHEHFAVQPISVITNVVTGPQYEDTENFSGVPEQDSVNLDQNETTEDVQMEILFEDGPTNVEFPIGPSEAAEPDYNWDQIEEEMARLYGQAFTEDDSKAMSDEPEPETEIKPIVLPKEQDNVDLDLLGALHEAQLRSRLEYIIKHWSLKRQAKLKRRFIELFGREDDDDDDQLSQISAKESAKCKQRIAPWIVKHLMPLYKEKRIASRHLFKSLAKHISDLLIQRILYPDECDVWMGVQEFFRGGTNIECEADFST